MRVFVLFTPDDKESDKQQDDSEDYSRKKIWRQRMSCFKHKRPRAKRKKKKKKKKKRDNKWSSDEARLPRLFSLAPIAGYNLKHIRLCSTALKELFIGFGNLFQSREEAARFYNIDFGQRNWQVSNEDEIDERKNFQICIYIIV